MIQPMTRVHQPFAIRLYAPGAQDDLASVGVDLKGLIDAGALELHYSELGIGGAGRESGLPAATVAEVATFPFAGVSGVYSTARDPWLVPMLKSYAIEFYAKLAAWLATPYNKTHRCGAARVALVGRGWDARRRARHCGWRRPRALARACPQPTAPTSTF